MGIITDRDIVIRAITKSGDITGAKGCVKKMEEEKIRRIVVVDESGKNTPISGNRAAFSRPYQAAVSKMQA